MDSVTQIVLGASVAHLTIGRQVGKRALLWGAVCGTVPDLDVLVPYDSVVESFTYHRSFTHSLPVLALLSPLVAWLITRKDDAGQALQWRWTLTVFVVFATHVLLDAFTTYGTQIFWPVSTHPVSLSSIFIIDPVYTLPLLLAVMLLLFSKIPRSSRLHGVNAVALELSSLYLGWTLLAKNRVESVAMKSLAADDISASHLFSAPAPFNSVLWRVVVMQDDHYLEGYYSFLDPEPEVQFTRYPTDTSLIADIASSWPVQRLIWFSKGIYSVWKQGSDVVITDLRMGAEDRYIFSFAVGTVDDEITRPIQAKALLPEFSLADVSQVWDRIFDHRVTMNR